MQCWYPSSHDPSDAAVMTSESEKALSSFEREVCSADIPSWRKEELLEHIKVLRVWPLDLTHLVAIYEALRQAKTSLEGLTQDEVMRSIERHWADCFVWRCQLGTVFEDRKAFYATVNQAFLGYTTEENFISKVGLSYDKCIGKVFWDVLSNNNGDVEVIWEV